MIDLKKEYKKESANVENSFDDNVVSKKRKYGLKEASAKKFLCVSLVLIVVFVSVVCIFINSRNKTLSAEEKINQLKEDISGTTITADNSSDSDNTQKGETVNATPKKEATKKTFNIPSPGTAAKPTEIKIFEDNPELTIVNLYYKISNTYEPDLVYVCNTDQRLQKDAAKAYEKMYNAGLKDGVTLTPDSGYRSQERQELNYNRKIKFYLSQGYTEKEATVKASTIILPAGSSEHNLGYAMDIVVEENWFKDTPEFEWLMKNAHKYGYVLRYPENKTEITKVIYEPWHWRYVGVENAEKMKKSGLCLEEYLGVVKK